MKKISSENRVNLAPRTISELVGVVSETMVEFTYTINVQEVAVLAPGTDGAAFLDSGGEVGTDEHVFHISGREVLWVSNLWYSTTCA